MMKITLLKPLSWTVTLVSIAMLLPNAVNAQCPYGNAQYPFGDVFAPTSVGEVIEVSDCSYGGEYANVTGFQAAYIYSIDVVGNPFSLSDPYITIFDQSNTVIAFGSAPLSFNPPVDGDYKTQWTDGCGWLEECQITTVTLVGNASACTDPAMAGSAVSSFSSVCASQYFSLSTTGASGGTGLTYQWQSSTDGITYADITGATGPIYGNTQSAATYYRVIVTCSSGTPDTSTSVQVTMNPFTNCYCTPMNDGGGCITNVSIDQINNTTPGCEGMNNYNQQSATTSLARGVSYNLSVTVDATDITSVWFDWDQSGTFDPTEWTQIYTNASTGNAFITVPLTALLGNTGMRIRSRLQNNQNGANDACIYMGSGETEDYIVTIAPAPTCPQPTAVTFSATALTAIDIQWTPGGTETEWEIEYGLQGFSVGTGTVVTGLTATNYALTGLTASSYYSFYVRSVCSATDTSFNTGPFNFNTFGQKAFLEWDSDCGPGFIDISGTGTNLNSFDDDSYGVSLPWPWLIKGSQVNAITIGNNGGIILNTLNGYVDYNPYSDGMYPYNQDLFTPLSGGGVFYQSIGSTPGSRQFIIQWKDLAHYQFFPPATDGATFEIVYDEATTQIYYIYDDVMMGNTAWDNGGDATIALWAGGEVFDVSINNPDYLTDHSCVNFSYTDCPRPTDFSLTYVTADEVAFTWTAGLANESLWLVEYGPTGFTPGTGSTVTESSAGSILTSLTQNTTYDVYIYAECNNGDTSKALYHSFTTLPNCSNPSGLTGATDIDSLETAWSWTQSSPSFPVTGFKIQYGITGFDLYTGTTVNASGINFADTTFSTGLLSGGVYDVYIQAVCAGTNDTSNFMGPITLTMPLTNDLVCNAEMLAADGTQYVFNNTGATVSLNESNIAPPANGAQVADGWTNSILNRTTWFKFVAPASGNVRINNTAINYNGQVAVYASTVCSNFGTFILQGANDNEIAGPSLAPNFTVCGLTPGTTYYLLHDGFTNTEGDYSISIHPIILEAGLAMPVTSICTGASVNLNSTISGNDPGGNWSSAQGYNAVNASINDSIFNSGGLAFQVFDLEYRVEDGCAYDAVIAQVHVFAPSNAGQNGVITACRNEPIDLLSGLNGTVDHGGTFYDPANQPIVGSQITTGGFPGQFNYDYIAGNGICPNDTATILVTIINCDWLGLADVGTNEILVYPNPSKGIVFIHSDATEAFDYVITDVKGRVITRANKGIKSAQTSEIDMSTVEVGIYFIRLTNAHTEKTFRIVIQ